MRSEEMTYQVMKFVGQKGFRRLMRLVAEVLRSAVVLTVAVLTVLAVVSCGSGSGDEPGPPGPVTPTPSPSKPTPTTDTDTPIVFSASQQEDQDVTRGSHETAAGTRASIPLEDQGVTTFKVWGYKNMSVSGSNYGDPQTVMPGYRVNWRENSAYSSVANTNDWEYLDQQQGQEAQQTIKYWDWSAKAYRFFGVTGAVVENNSGPYEFSMLADASNSSAIDDTPYFSRLWFSTGNQATYPDKQFGKPVQLEFVKPYARVRFVFNYSYPREGFKLTEKNFKPTDGGKIARKGTVTVHYPTEGTATKEWYTMSPQTGVGSGELDNLYEDYDPEDDGKVYPADAPGGWWMVLPNITQGSYTLSVNVNGSVKTVVVPGEYMQWLPGYSYTYIFKITEEGGVEIGWVEYAVTKWSEMEIDRSVYNW